MVYIYKYICMIHIYIQCPCLSMYILYICVPSWRVSAPTRRNSRPTNRQAGRGKALRRKRASDSGPWNGNCFHNDWLDNRLGLNMYIYILYIFMCI